MDIILIYSGILMPVIILTASSLAVHMVLENFFRHQGVCAESWDQEFETTFIKALI